MLNLCWEIISKCAYFLIDFEGSYIIMGSLLVCTALAVVYSLIKGF